MNTEERFKYTAPIFLELYHCGDTLISTLNKSEWKIVELECMFWGFVSLKSIFHNYLALFLLRIN